MKKHDIGTRIKLLRGRESRPSFAARFGVSIATLARYESGETAPNALFIMGLCEQYKVGTDWLLYGKETESPERKEEGESFRSNQAGLHAPGPQAAIPTERPFGGDWSAKELKNEIDNSNLTSAIKTLDCDDFDRLWTQFKSESEARRGWLQIELIKRFPEFLEWLESRPFPLNPPLPVTLNKDEMILHPGLPLVPPED